MGDRHIRKRLPDDGDARASDFFNQGRLEYAARSGIECLGVIEGGFLGEEHVLCQKFALEAIEIGAQRLLAIGEFPMAGHRFDAEQVRGLDHVSALHGVGESGSLPQIAAIEQHRAARSGIAAQAVDQRLEMGEAAKLSESRGGFLEIETGKGIGVGTVRLDPKSLQKSPSDQMRRLAGHCADPEIDARFAKINRR